MQVIRHSFSHWRTMFATISVLILLLLSVGRGDDIPYLKSVAGAYEQDLVRWEITHSMDKWLAKAADILLPGRPSQEERLEDVASFFALRDDLHIADGELEQALAAQAPNGATNDAAANAASTIDDLQAQRRQLQTGVEETLESAISGVVSDLGIIDSFGPVDWPPVDFTFENRALLLVRSPRDAIVRLEDLLLDPGVPLLDQVRLEEDVEAIDNNTSALVVRIGGVATYPAQVSPRRTLHGTLEIAAHEWLHHWLIFRPLGRKWSNGGELQSINETLANIFGQEVGDASLELLTGEVVNRPPWTPPTLREREEPPAYVFDFRREMRSTRTELERFLAESSPDTAEAYLEERRLEFRANGFNIRKLNNAWFAFNGTYADSAASISPVEGQLRTIRAASPDLTTFLANIASISKTGQLETMALGAGWVRP
jgi:hypothetical protein